MSAIDEIKRQAKIEVLRELWHSYNILQMKSRSDWMLALEDKIKEVEANK